MNNHLRDICVIGNDKRLEAITRILRKRNIEYRIVGNESKNIVVSINESPSRLVIGAHYDAYFEGANDNGAACIILLNLIERLRDDGRSIDFVFFDKEEHGGIGSSEYIEHIGKQNIKGFINLDMCGLGTNVCITSNRNNDDLPFGCMRQMMEDENAKVFDRFPFGDYDIFDRNGIPSVFIINSTDNDLGWFHDYSKGKVDISKLPDFARTMHRQSDTVDTVDIEGMEKIFDFIMKHA